MMKKILVLSIIACFLFQNTALYAQDYSMKSLILARNELLQTKKGKSYVTQLEMALPKMTETQLEGILTRINTLSADSQNLSKAQTALIQYIDLAIQKELLTRSGELSQSEIQEIENTIALSKVQTQAVETDIIAAQKLLQKNLENTMQSLQKTWKSMSSYEETGTMSMDFDMNLENLGTIDSGISLKNYSAKQKNFDQQLSGQFEAFLNASFAGEDIKARGSSLIDFISKDGNMYFLAKNLETKLEPLELEQSMETQDIIAKLKELATQNTYIKISDPEAAQGMEILRTLSPESALSQSSKLLQTALLTPIAKKGENYVMIPSKHMCDSFKELSGVFDPFAGKTCSESQYKNILSDMQEAGIEILYTPGINKKIEILFDESDITGNIRFLWNEKNLISLTGKIIDPENPTINYITMSYIPQKTFEMKWRAENKVSLDIGATLSPTGIETLMIDGNIEDSLIIKLQYKDTYLSSSLSYDDTYTAFSCSLFGPLTSTTSKLEGKCSFDSEELKYSLGSPRLDLLFTLDTDTSSNKNNMSFTLQGISNKKEFMKFILTNTATRNTNSNFTITAPSKTVDIEEVMGEIYKSEY